MKHTILHLTTLALVALAMLSLPTEGVAQEAPNPLEGLRVSSQTVATRQGAKAVIDFDLDLTQMQRLKSNMVLKVVPTLRANDGSEQLDLPAISISGRTRAIMLRRTGEEVDIVRSKSGEQHYHYTTEVPFALWMKDASLLFDAKGYGCAGCDLGDYTTLLTPHALAPLYQPTYRYALLVPEGEETKRREESLTAMITFPVNNKP